MTKLLQQGAKSRKLLYFVLGLILVVSVITAIWLSDSNPKAVSLAQNPKSNVNIGTPTSSPTTNVTLVTKNEALSVAMPIINQYASANNRTITNLTVTSSLMADNGTRGGLTLQQVLAENLTASEAHNQFSYYPVWSVIASFQWTNPLNGVDGTSATNSLTSNLWINGYSVVIWADTGQIAYSEPQGAM